MIFLQLETLCSRGWPQKLFTTLIASEWCIRFALCGLLIRYKYWGFGGLKSKILWEFNVWPYELSGQSLRFKELSSFRVTVFSNASCRAVWPWFLKAKKPCYVFIGKLSLSRKLLALLRLLYLTHLVWVWYNLNHQKCCFVLCLGLFCIISGKQSSLFCLESILYWASNCVMPGALFSVVRYRPSLLYPFLHVFYDVLFWQWQQLSLILAWFLTSNLRISQTDFHKADLLSFCLEATKILSADILRQRCLLSLTNLGF